MKIPFISVQHESEEVRATFALSLTEIRPSTGPAISQDALLYNTRWKEAHERTVRLMSIIARWQHPVACELHILSEPSLLPDVRGRNHINIVWHVRANNDIAATELALSDSLKTELLLRTFWPNSEWSFVEESHFQKIATPFLPESCLCVCHRKEHISSTQPFIADRYKIGFRASSRAELSSSAPTILEHLYPWVPPVGEDLSSLMESLLRLPSPRWIIVRISNDGTIRIAPEL